MAFLLGSTVTLRVTFTNEAGVNTDPTTVTLTYGDAAGSPTTLTFGVDGALVKDTTGKYHADIIPDAVGTWLARWTGTGAVETVEETQFDVAPSAQPWDPPASPPAYASLDQLRVALRVSGGNAAVIDDTELLRCLQTASREIDGEVAKRSLGAVTKFYDNLDFPTVPAPIAEATILLAVALWKRPQAPFGVLQSQLDGSAIQVGKDFHVDALITSVVPWHPAAL